MLLPAAASAWPLLRVRATGNRCVYFHAHQRLGALLGRDLTVYTTYGATSGTASRRHAELVQSKYVLHRLLLVLASMVMIVSWLTSQASQRVTPSLCHRCALPVAAVSPDRDYLLDLSVPDEREMARMLVRLAVNEPGGQYASLPASLSSHAMNVLPSN